MQIGHIWAGKRHPRHVGDVRSLAASIERVGLLHPVVVDGSGRLIAGARRLAAVQLLGWRDVPVRVVRGLADAADALRAERDENAERQAFTPSELVSITRALEPLEAAEAKMRQASGLKRGSRHARAGKLPEREKGQRRDKLAAVVGVSGRTLDKARAVVEAAERNPRRYQSIVADMDRTGNVSAAFASMKRLEWQEQAAHTRVREHPSGIEIRHCSMEALLGSMHEQCRAIICDPLYDKASVPQLGSWRDSRRKPWNRAGR
jgi:hypothetical protein